MVNISNRVVFIKLADLLDSVVLWSLKESNRGGNAAQREIRACAAILAYSFLLRALSIRHLSKGTPKDLPSQKADSAATIDEPSLDTLLRAEIESFLTLHWIFVEPQSSTEKEYRFLIYKVQGINQVLKLPLSREDSESIRINEKHRVDLQTYRERIIGNEFFHQLSEKERQAVLDKIDSKKRIRWIPTWRDIARRAGFSESLANFVYGVVSASAHSEFLALASAIPWEDSESIEKMERHTFYVLNIMVANMISGLSSLFPSAAHLWQAEKPVVQFWVDAGRQETTFSVG